MLEHPELRCRLIDLAPSVEEGEVSRLVQELFSQSPENQIAFRESARHVLRLKRLSTEGFSRIAHQATDQPNQQMVRGEQALESDATLSDPTLSPLEAAENVSSAEEPEHKKLFEKPQVENTTTESTLFLQNATYLITGGLGVLGLLLSQWMVEQGARHLVLVGRRAPSAEAADALTILRETGAEIMVIRADVAQEGQVADLLSSIRHAMPPLRGIIHAAMQIEDGVLLQMDRERFSAAVKPKANGAWNLHRLTSDTRLDFFVLFSSAASLFGSIGQGNYVAGNAFLDALAHHRRSLGLHALSINWGQWAETHLTTRPGLRERLALLGMDPLPPERGFEALAYLLRHDATQVAVMSVQWQKVFASLAGGLWPPLLEKVVPLDSADAMKTKPAHGALVDREAFLAVSTSERQMWMVMHVQNLVAQVLRHSPSEVSVQQPLNLIGGLDSLMAIEIKNRLETGLGIELPLVRLLEGPTIVEFAEIICEVLCETPLANGNESFTEVLERVKQLSEDEVQVMLEAEKFNQ